MATHKPFNDVFLELLALTYADDNAWSYNRYHDLYSFNCYDSEYNGLIITLHDNNIFVTHDLKTYEIKPSDESYKLGMEVYKSAKTLYNIKHDLENWKQPYQYDSGAIDRECRNVFKDFYY